MAAPADRHIPTAITGEQAPSVSSEGNETSGAEPTSAGTPAFGPPVEPGEVGKLGPYRIVKELGRGGMGAVYAALDTRLGRRLALKVMLPQYAANATAKERFLREARAAAQISHDNVVTVYEADERDGVPYIAMQFLEGYPLDEYLKRKGSPGIPQILRIAREAAAGLAAAHKLGLVHRDIKPGNLWLEAPEGRVKVLDFGLAKPVDTQSEVTRSGAIIGTPAFMSPEQARGEKVDARTDLFSLGGVLYRLCTGRLPFQGPTTMVVLMALGTEEPPPVRSLNRAVPEPLAELIHQLLTKNAAARPATADAVVQRIRVIARQFSSGSIPTAIQPTVVPAPIPVTMMPSEANPFADIDATDTSSSQLQPIPAPAAEPVKPQSKKPLLVAAGLLGLLIAVAGVIVIITNKDGTKTKIEVPDNATVEVKDKTGKTLAKVPPPVVVDATPDRKAAEYVLSIGGGVYVNSEIRNRNKAADLPKDRFTLTGVFLGGNKQVTDTGLAVFDGCTGLTVLHLSGTNVTDEGLEHFRGCTGLTTLGLKGTAVTGSGLAALNCAGLTSIDLAGTPVTDAGLANLRGCTGLTTLYLHDTNVTDAGLANFRGFTGLTSLGLSKKATDAGLAYFEVCKGLKTVIASKTAVTATGLERFHAAVPGCKITHDGGVIEGVDVDRKAAEYVLALGGKVWVNGEGRIIVLAADLPKDRGCKINALILRREWLPIHRASIFDRAVHATIPHNSSHLPTLTDDCRRETRTSRVC